MAQSMVTNSKPSPVRSAAPEVPLDEELWFGTSDSDAAERAAANSMAATAGKVVGAKHFPESARKLAELCGRENTPVQEFVRVLEQDPALSAQLLRVVNSAGFSLRRRCTSVQQAVTLVGSKQLNQIATTAAVLDMFDSQSEEAVRVLEHSAVMGAFCRYLGAHLALPADDLFAIGVMHDIGKLMMLDSFGERYQALISQSQGHADALHPLERREFGFDHGVLAAHVLKAWQIPDPIPKIVSWHHEPARAYKSSTAHAALVQTVRLADTLAHAITSGARHADVPELARHEAASYLDISEAQLGALWSELVQIHAQARGVEAPAAEPEGSAPPEGRASLAGGRASIEGRASIARATPLAAAPKQFPCVECGTPSFGASCPTCKGDLCPEHPVGSAGWCQLCARDYAAFTSKAPFPFNLGAGAFIALALALLVATVACASVQGLPVAQGVIAGCLVSGLITLTAVIAQRSYLRTRFVRSQPARTSARAAT